MKQQRTTVWLTRAARGAALAQLFIAFALPFLIAPARAQKVGPEPALDRLPAWPADIKRPADLHGRYVFRDPKTLEVVIAFPSLEDPATLTIYRYRPQNQVKAVINVSFTPVPQGKLRYRFTVADQNGASLAITAWFLVGPDIPADLEVVKSSWNFVILHNPLKQAAIETAPAGRPLYWSAAGSGATIRPGAPAHIFEIISSFRPGLTSAYFQGGEPFSTSGGDLPLEVSAQLEPFMTMDQTNQIQLTVGPRFSSDLDLARIATAWQTELGGIRKLLDDAAEPGFYERVDSIANACAASAGAGCLSLDARKYLELPRTGIARDIAGALLITFQ